MRPTCSVNGCGLPAVIMVTVIGGPESGGAFFACPYHLESLGTIITRTGRGALPRA